MIYVGHSYGDCKTLYLLVVHEKFTLKIVNGTRPSWVTGSEKLSRILKLATLKQLSQDIELKV